MSLARNDVAQPEQSELGVPLGPDSLTWRYFGDNRMALLGPRAAVLQNMLPSLAQGVEDHSVWFEETLARLQRSIPPIFNTVYGADGRAAGHQVRDFHMHKYHRRWWERWLVDFSKAGLPAKEETDELTIAKLFGKEI